MTFDVRIFYVMYVKHGYTYSISKYYITGMGADKKRAGNS